tara:strand:+ start:684 stop:1454 length:771 start_codon:yes stop_codon:yes gene_type:complete
MSYIGRNINNLSDRAKLDSISTSATATFNLLLNSVAYVPSSAESLTVSLNGVIQAPQSSYTVSGSTIVFASNLASSDVIDFILAERAITLTTIGSGTVNTNNIVDNAVTSAKLASGLALGKIGQVVYATYATSTSISSTTFADTGLSANITPSATSSKVLVMATIQGLWNRGTASTALEFKIFRGTTEIQHTVKTSNFISTGVTLIGTTVALNIVDSPSSSSELNYKIQFAGNNSDQNTINSNNDVSSITLMEVLA